MRKRPVIIYVGAFELPDKNAAAHRVVANAKIFKELGYDVVFLGIDKTLSSREGTVKQSEPFFGFDCWNFTYPNDMKRWIIYITDVSGLKYLLETCYRGRVKMVINYNYPAVAQFRALRLCRRNGVKHIADITEWYDSSAGPLIWRLVKKVDTALRMYFVNLLEDGLITTSSYITERYEKRGIKTVELPTLFDCNSFEEHDLVETSKDILKLVYVCSPLDPKMVNKDRSNLKERLDEIVTALFKLHKQNYNFQLDVYGNTEDEYLEVFAEHNEILKKMKNKINFYGLTPNKILRNRIASADFMIFIRDENRVTISGFPGKLAESISLGTPVITNRMANIQRFVNSGCIIAADRGNELPVLIKVAQYTSIQKKALKKFCKNSRLFHYSHFTQDVNLFFRELGMENIQNNKEMSP